MNKLTLQATLEQETSPQKKRKSPADKESETNNSQQLSNNANGSAAEKEQNKDPPEDEQGVAEGTTEEAPCDAQMGAATLESLEAREDFKRQLEAIMDATKVATLPLKSNEKSILKQGTLDVCDPSGIQDTCRNEPKKYDLL